ncbi:MULTISPECIES: hypothetical protein [Streptomyces]|uniref:hypothetical protein n=1 Tax=Streptomyces TaxID=1883 RepID=UPI00200E8D9F|nr:hypothetical protein [Streptomyces sp. LRE541]UPZ32750.1 hypothetical protein MUK60_36165 [Streptomyces sp. LRE541]
MAKTSGIPGAMSRRTFVTGLGTASLVATLAACGHNDKEQAPPGDSPSDSPSPSPSSPRPSDSPSPPSAPGSPTSS